MSAQLSPESENTIFQLLADNISQLAWVADSHGSIIWYNKRWYEYTGTTFEDMKGWGWKAVHHPDHLDRVVALISSHFESGEEWEDTFPLRGQNGEYRWFLSRAKPIHDASGALLYWFGTNTDITEQRVLEEELRQSENRIRAMADAINHMIWVTRPDGYHEYYNKRWYEYTGVPQGSTDGEEWNGMFHEDDQARAWERWSHSLKTGEPYEIEYRLRHRSGEYRWVLGRAMPHYNAQGAIIKWFGTCTDIHDLKEAEARAEAANKAKSAFLANMSHEIRTPMNAIVGLSNILAKKKELPGDLHELIDTLRISSQSLLDLINDLLDISKIEESELQTENIEFDLQELIHEAVRINRVKAQEKALTLTEKVNSTHPLRFMGDAVRLRQILLNLLNNAIKFTEKGEVTISYRIPENTAYNIQIDVTDTGIGIEKSKIDEVFEKFTQADNTISRRFGGTGLGLAISRGIAEQMGGTLTAASEFGKGTTFTLLLSLKPATHSEASVKETKAHAPTGPVSATKEKILLVEDYPANILVATFMIKEMGYDLDVAQNGEEALNILKDLGRPAYRAVLMDMQMPRIDGLEVTRRVRKFEQEQGLEPMFIIAVTANAFLQDRQACLEAGMDDYLSKPFEPNDLQALLQDRDAA